jgi:plastocyanin
MRHTLSVLAFFALACGGSQPDRSTAGQADAANADRPPAGVPAPASAPRASSTTYEVRMEMVKNKYFFNPAALTIKPGDVVRWININGGPHNVQFKKDRIPPGSLTLLETAMPQQIAGLTGPFLRDSLATYSVTFENMPPGTYAYACQPHEILGMTGTITVAP